MNAGLTVDHIRLVHLLGMAAASSQGLYMYYIHRTYRAGSIVHGSVVSVEDHGYVIHLGYALFGPSIFCIYYFSIIILYEPFSCTRNGIRGEISSYLVF